MKIGLLLPVVDELIYRNCVSTSSVRKSRTTRFKKLYDPTIFYAVDEDAVLCEVLEKVPALVSFHQSPLYSSVRAEEVSPYLFTRSRVVEWLECIAEIGDIGVFPQNGTISALASFPHLPNT